MAKEIYEDALAEAFPAVNAGVRPFGSRVLVQIRTPRKISKGGIIFSTGDQDTEKWNTQVAKVVALGPVAFKNRTTLEGWPEGEWCSIGQFVRVPKYGGDRWEVPVPSPKKVTGDDVSAMFVLFNDLDLLGDVYVDPLSVKAFI
jgi:co-chaperonin GroES (HSP10)